MIIRTIQYIINCYKIKSNPINYFRSLDVTIGDNCRFINPKGSTFGSEPYLVTIGNHVTITSEVKFITHDGGVWVFRDKYPDIDVVAPIKIGNNVFIGIACIIMPGVTIGDNCVIGAGSIVTKDIPANNVAVGVPAKPIKTLDQYWQNIEKKAFYIRSYPLDKKQAFLKEKFDHE